MFQENIDTEPNMLQKDLTHALVRIAIGSHATIYNEAHYGRSTSGRLQDKNLFYQTIGEYIHYMGDIGKVSGDVIGDSSVNAADIVLLVNIIMGN